MKRRYIKYLERDFPQAFFETKKLELDSKGRIWRNYSGNQYNSYKCKRHRAEQITTKGYYCISVHINKKRYGAMAHRLIWQMKYGNIPDGYEINHKNGVKTDNRIKNLEAVTPSRNKEHAIKELGVFFGARGERSGMSKLKDKDVIEIRILRKQGEKVIDIAKKYNLSISTISTALNNRSWTHVKEEVCL